MKAQFEQEDLEAIAQRVVELLKPILKNSKDEEDTIFDIHGLAEYLQIKAKPSRKKKDGLHDIENGKFSTKWIYERTHLKEIPHLKIDGLLRFRKRDIDKWLNSYFIPATNISERISQK
jgi:fructose-1,6-bisphosphatase